MTTATIDAVRRAFETWAVAHRYDLTRNAFYDDRYLSERTQDAWTAWLAATENKS